MDGVFTGDYALKILFSFNKTDTYHGFLCCQISVQCSSFLIFSTFWIINFMTLLILHNGLCYKLSNQTLLFYEFW